MLCRTQNDRTKALILKRSADEQEGPNLWTIPGGKVEYADLGEPQKTADRNIQWRWVLERTLEREVFEETGIRARLDQFYPLRGGDLIFRRKDGMPCLVTTHYLLLGGTTAVRLGDGAT
ncbi:MAG: NUDIX domain-containing protein, partial [Parcubacteria group bacterium]|nr:NUDIX domain-containing protein [Parcubacteria group bacterium]